MTQKKCRSCGTKIVSGVKFCPECGAPATGQAREMQAKANKSSSNTVRDMVIIVGVIVVATAGYFLFKEPSQPPQPVPQQSMNDVEGHAGMVGSMDEALQAMGGLPQDYNSLVQFGNQQMDQRNFPVAAEAYRRAMALDGSSNAVRTDYGACLHGMGLGQRALEEFKKVLSIEPDHPIANFNAGIVFREMGELDSARVYWENYLRVDPNGSAVASAKALLKELDG